MSQKMVPLEYLNLRPRCWFILARGATPSTAIKKTFFGLIMRNSTCYMHKEHNCDIMQS